MVRKLTRGELVRVIRELQTLIGQIEGAYSNDRASDRADKIHALCDVAFNKAIDAIAGDPPERRSRSAIPQARSHT